MKIKKTKADCTIEAKRIYLPVIIKDECPECGTTDEEDYSYEQYFSDITLNNPEPVFFYCVECDEEWSQEVIINFTIKTVK